MEDVRKGKRREQRWEGGSGKEGNVEGETGK